MSSKILAIFFSTSHIEADIDGDGQVSSRLKL